MLPDPLHPALVHLPLALALLAPFASLMAALALARAWLPVRAWAAVVALQALLAGSAWLALESGQDQEERVEKVVGEQPLEAHEEAAERFLAVAVLTLVVSGAGLLPGAAGSVGRLATGASGALLLAAGLAVGHSGGELVYVHGAAQAYVKSGAPRSGGEAGVGEASGRD